MHSVTYAYEPGRNAVQSIENKETVGTPSVVSNYGYTMNALGQRVGRTQSGAAFAVASADAFSYDYLGQVTASANHTHPGAAWNPLYAYDEIGNRAGDISDLHGTVNYTANALNQYTAVDGYSFPAPPAETYDADGNLLGRNGLAFTWNGENRLTQISDGASLRVRFTYDAQGRQLLRIRETSADGGQTWTEAARTAYLYDGWNRVAELSVDAAATPATLAFQPLDVLIFERMGGRFLHQAHAVKAMVFARGLEVHLSHRSGKITILTKHTRISRMALINHAIPRKTLVIQEPRSLATRTHQH